LRDRRELEMRVAGKPGMVRPIPLAVRCPSRATATAADTTITTHWTPLSERRITTVLKRVIVTTTILAIVVALLGLYLLRRAPDWYARAVLTDEERAMLARESETQLLRAREYAAAAHAAEARSATNPSFSPTPSEPFVAEFSQEGINSIVEKWGDLNDWRAGYEQYVKDPIIIFRKDRIILAGLVKDFGAVVSLHFAPKIDDKGQMRLDLVKVLGGNLPMPESMYAGYRERITNGLKRKMIGWQREAAINSDGTANTQATVASLARMMLAALNGQPSDAVLFLPAATGKDGSVPMRVTHLTVNDAALSMTIRPLKADERSAIIERLKQPPPPPTVATTGP